MSRTPPSGGAPAVGCVVTGCCLIVFGPLFLVLCYGIFRGLGRSPGVAILVGVVAVGCAVAIYMVAQANRAKALRKVNERDTSGLWDDQV
jgi:hypothetical protein